MTGFLRSAVVPVSLALLLLLLPGSFAGLFLNVKAVSANGVSSTIPVGSNPNFMAYDATDNKMFVVNTGSGSVTAINAATNAVLATIKVTKPNDIIYNPTNDEVYVVSENLHVVAISGSSDKIVKSISVQVDDFHQDLAYDAANGNVYVANANPGSVAEISSSTNSVIAMIKTGSHPQHLLFDPANNNLYVSVGTVTSGLHPKSPYVDVISSSTNKVVATITLAESPGSHPDAFFAYNPANLEVYQSDDVGHVYVISSATNTLLTTLTLFTTSFCCTLLTMAYDPSNMELYAAAAGTGIWAISSTNSVVATLSLTGANGYLGYDSVDSDIFVAGGTTYVVSGASVVTSFATANGASAAFNPAGGTVYESIMQIPGSVDVISS
jgi:YVTN family beta-propeller protein